jgi:hypothetical protein
MAEPTVVDKDYEVDLAILGVPNLDVGGGVGGGLPLRLGVGAVFGPLNRPEDLSGFGIGVSGSLGFVAGGQAKLVGVMRKPPLFMLMGGYSIGTSAKAELHGNIQYLMDLEEFVGWIKKQTGGGPS